MKNIIHFLIKKKQLEEILIENMNTLFSQAFYYTGKKEDAEDLIQDLFIKIINNKSSLPKKDKIKPWLLRCLYNQFIDNYRKNKRTVYIDNSNKEYYFESTSGTTHAEEDIINHEIIIALGQLSKKQRAIIYLHDISGYSLPELSDILQTPLGTLKSTLHRGRNALKEKLGMEPFPANERYRDKGDKQ